MNQSENVELAGGEYKFFQFEDVSDGHLKGQLQTSSTTSYGQLLVHDKDKRAHNHNYMNSNQLSESAVSCPRSKDHPTMTSNRLKFISNGQVDNPNKVTGTRRL